MMAMIIFMGETTRASQRRYDKHNCRVSTGKGAPVPLTEPTRESLTYWLRRWLPEADDVNFEPLGQSSGFSGARLWRVTVGENSYVLRQWPGSGWSGCRVNAIVGFQRYLSNAGLPAPRPIHLHDSLGGACIVTYLPKLKEPRSAVTWSLTSWLPGVANFSSDPRPEKLQAALEMLARFHISAADMEQLDRGKQRRFEASPALRKRAEGLRALNASALEELAVGVKAAADAHETELATEALRLIAAAKPSRAQLAESWRVIPLPLQWRLGDVWHDHVLFTGNHVTGLIDYGAADIDSPAADVGRLLGSLVGDDRERWQQGLAAYEAVRPMSDDERHAAKFFDSSGTVVAAANWIGWLWPREPEHAPPIASRDAALARLATLVARLRNFNV
jgi:Ser/Thr protein kinase RdoA (MazF antagonist)